MDKFNALTPEAIAQARARFDAGQSRAEIAHGLGVHPTTLSRWSATWGWPQRSAVAGQSADGAILDAEAHGPARIAPITGADEALDTLRLLRGVRRAVAHELDNLGDGRSGEARARTLASLTRTLDVLRSVESRIYNDKTGPTGDDDADDPPVDVAELRRELARRLDRMRREREPA